MSLRVMNTGLRVVSARPVGDPLRVSRDLLQQALTDREIQRVNLQTLSFRIVEREAGVLMRHHANDAETALSNSCEIEHGDDRVVDLEQEAQSVALRLELLPDRLCLFEMERVVHRHRDQSSDLVQKYDVRLRIGTCCHSAAKSQRPKLSERGGGGNNTERSDSAIGKPAGEIRESRVVADRTPPTALASPAPIRRASPSDIPRGAEGRYN